MGYISTRMMECEDAFSDMGSLRQNLELPPEYAYDDGEAPCSRERNMKGSSLGFCRCCSPAHLQGPVAVPHMADEDSELEDAMVLGSTPTFGSTPRG